MLDNKVAIVTGGSRGIGRAIVHMLASQKCHVAFNYAQSESQAQDLEKEILEKGVKCKASCVDIKNFTTVKEWVENVKNEFGGLDILINNAGIINDKALVMMNEADWKSVIDTNLNGMINATRACIFSFLKEKKGNIINISSVSGIMGLPRQTNYSASKGGMNAFTKSLAKEVAEYGIRVNAVAPGFIETDILSDLTQELREQILQMIPLSRVGSTDDVSNCVKFLLSEESAYITGQILTVDGGLVMR